MVILRLRNVTLTTLKRRKFPRYELRRCVRTRTRAKCGRTCACACEIHSGKCAGCACMRPFYGRAMCDCTLYFLHTFWDKIARKCYVFEHLFLLWNILSGFGSSYSDLEHLILFLNTKKTMKIMKSC